MRFLAVVCAVAGLIVAVPALAADRQVDDNLVPCVSGLPIHGTIGAAVAAASAGETILVCAGTYSENVTVNKPDLTLRAQGVVYLKPGAAPVAGIVVVNADGVTIQGFDISGFTSGCGTRVGFGVSTSRVDIRDNRIHGNSIGICMRGGTDLRVRYNTIQNNTDAGIFLRDTVAPEVSNNTVRNNGFSGIELLDGQGAAIDHNALTGNQGYGIAVFASSPFAPADGVVITNNTVRGPTSVGIVVSARTGVVLTRNLVQNAGQGVLLSYAKGATASFNSISFNAVGLDIGNTTGATVTRNNVSRSTIVDCRWDGAGVNVLTGNSCGTQDPAGAFD